MYSRSTDIVLTSSDNDCHQTINIISQILSITCLLYMLYEVTSSMLLVINMIKQISELIFSWANVLLLKIEEYCFLLYDNDCKNRYEMNPDYQIERTSHIKYIIDQNFEIKCYIMKFRVKSYWFFVQNLPVYWGN